MNSDIKDKFLWLTVFSLSMAALEAAVVVYLRELYYADGFTVALRITNARIVGVEILREAATISMLICLSVLSGKSGREKFAWFLISFAVWDLGYYGWLKIFLDWPASVFDWDILFLIPVAWLAPVLAPVICSITMLVLAVVLLADPKAAVRRTDTLMLSAGSLIILVTFMADYFILLTKNGLWNSLFSLLSNPVFTNAAQNFVPDSFRWILFAAGEGLLISVILTILSRSRFMMGRRAAGLKLKLKAFFS